MIEPDRGEGSINRQTAVDGHDRHPCFLRRVEMPVVSVEQRDREDDQRIDSFGAHEVDAPAFTFGIFGVGQEQTVPGLTAGLLRADRHRWIEGVGHFAHDETDSGRPFGDQAAGGMIGLVIQRRDGSQHPLRVSTAICLCRPLRTFETVDIETPAAIATERIVTCCSRTRSSLAF